MAKKEKKPGKKKKELLITRIIQIFMLVVFVACIVLAVFAEDENFTSYFIISAFTSLLTIALTFVPSILNDNTPIVVPSILQAVYVVFVLLAEFFGEILRFYDRFPWWDTMLHTSSGVLLGMMGVLVVYSLNRKEGIIQKMHPVSIMLFAFCFAMACGAVWEIFEYTGDRLLGMNMQRSIYVTSQKGTPEFEQEAIDYFNENIVFYDNLEDGKTGRLFDIGLVDTMEDIIVDAIGAIVSVVLTYLMMNAWRKRRAERVGSNEPEPDLIDVLEGR